MSGNVIGYLLQLVLMLGLALWIYRLLQPSLRALLAQVFGSPEGPEFYMRVLLLVLVFSSLSEAINDRSWDQDPGEPFIEYVWNFTSTFSGVLENMGTFFIVFLVLVTILAAVARRRPAA